MHRSHTDQVSLFAHWPLLTALVFASSLAACGGEIGDTGEVESALGAATVPGRVEAENFSDGPSGYFDTTKGNSGSAYRTTNVDIQPTTDKGGGYNVGWVSKGEWLKYSINVERAGKYHFVARVASAVAGTKKLHLELDGAALPSASFTDASGWQSWRDLVLGDKEVSAGTHVLRVVMDADRLNLNYIDVSFAAGTPPPRPDAKLVPPSGAWLGEGPDYTGAGSVANFRAREAQIGRKFDIFHAYHAWADAFPNATEQQLSAEGRILMLNWKSPGGSSWPGFATGYYDSQITTTANRLKAFGKPIFITFHHEPENDGGSATAYAAAYRHVVLKFRALGVTNVVWVWNMMGFSGYGSLYESYYPGDDVVDWIGFDPYNWFSTPGHVSPWKSFSAIVSYFYDWAHTNHPTRPLMLVEFGTPEHGGGSPSKADWFRAIPSELKNLPMLKALLYFDLRKDGMWALDTSADSLAGFKAMAHDPFFNQPH